MVPANVKQFVVKSPAVKDNSKVFITPRTSTDKTIAVTAIKTGESFTAELSSPAAGEIKFDYWIVGAE